MRRDKRAGWSGSGVEEMALVPRPVRVVWQGLAVCFLVRAGSRWCFGAKLVSLYLAGSGMLGDGGLAAGPPSNRGLGFSASRSQRLEEERRQSDLTSC